MRRRSASISAGTAPLLSAGICETSRAFGMGFAPI